MEPLQQDDPRRIGPYTTLLRFRETASTVQYVAHGGPDDATVVVSLARPGLAALAAFRRRFEAEARTADRLAGGWVPAPAGAATDGPQLWTAYGYVPALTLAEAIALAGPLPERAVRILGAGLAETLSRVHATGTVLHGLTPETVLLAADGPRLAAFGALGAAAHAQAGPGGRLSVRLASLTPEQVKGEQPGTASDIFVLGLLLAYAATGTTPVLPDDASLAARSPELGGVPEELRDLVASCLAGEPASRPTAGTAAATLALEGASALAKDGWLPEPVVTALAAQTAAVSAARPPADTGTGRKTLALGAVGLRVGDKVTAALGIPRARVGGAAPVPSAPSAGGVAGPSGAGPAAMPAPASAPAPAVSVAAPVAVAPDPAAAPKSDLTASVLAAKAGAERRVVVAAAAAGAAGLLLGGGIGVAVAGGDAEPAAAPATPAKAPAPIPGVPPAPIWAYAHTGSGPFETAVWRDRILVIGDARQRTGVDLRSGRRLWTQPGAQAAHRPFLAGDSVFVIGATNFLWLSPQDGTVRHRVAAPAHITSVAAADGPVVWFTGTAGAGTYLFAYDAVARKELWRTQVPNGRARDALPKYQGVAVRPDGILVRQDGASLTPQQRKADKGLALFTVYDRVSGKRLSGTYFTAVLPDTTVSGDTAGRVYAAVGDGLHAFDSRSAKRVWQAAGTAAPGATGRNAFGEGVVHDGTLYVGTAHHQLHALDAATGTTRWSRSTEAGGGGRPRVLLSSGARTALALEATQVTAFRTADGSRLWKFQDAGGTTPAKPGGYRGVVAGRTAVVWRDSTLYALPLDR
ncbi:outer membrane protein assembly factor BamB family protein [Streptomyces sp. NPDC001970]